MANIKATKKAKQDSIKTKELIVLSLTIIIVILLYLIFKESHLINVISAILISVGVTYLIKYTFELNGDIEEERVFFNTIISIIILLFASLTSLTFLNSSICSNSSNTMSNTIPSCSVVIPLTGEVYAAFLITFFVFLIMGVALRLNHKKSEKIFSLSKFFSYWALTFLILIELVLILTIAGILH